MILKLPSAFQAPLPYPLKKAKDKQSRPMTQLSPNEHPFIHNEPFFNDPQILEVTFLENWQLV